ncbi:MAG: hypothetical protein OXG15_06310 [Gammaproteobacteria bacterium]|nr:hypothetical protein [Gammaproteobacteria bacterium]
MFKTSVVLCAVLFTCLHLVTACSVLDPQSIHDIAESSKKTVAQELVAESSNHLANTTRPIYVQARSAPDWLRDALIDELTANQYFLAQDAVNARQLAAVATELGADALHVLLTVDDQQVLQRVFRFEPTVSHRVWNAHIESDDEPTNFAARFNETSAPVTELPMRELASVDYVPTPDSTVSSIPQPSTPNESSDSFECANAVLQQGSLKQSLIQILQSCGWRLALWPADPNKPKHELDWLVPSTQTLPFKSLEDLVQALRIAFDLDIKLNQNNKTVRVQLRN